VPHDADASVTLVAAGLAPDLIANLALIEATSNDGFGAAGACAATGITATAVAATTNTTLHLRCRISFLDGCSESDDWSVTPNCSCGKAKSVVVSLVTEHLLRNLPNAAESNS
jgi:hypothetical protein